MLARHVTLVPNRYGPASAENIRVLSGFAALESCRDAWSQLWSQAAGATPFQSPAWLLSWARHFAPDRLHALAVHEGARLVAFVPFFTWQGKVLLAGTGPSDYGDGLFACDDELVGAALARLCAAAQELECGCVDLQQLRAESPLLRAPTPDGWRDETSTGVACPVAPLRVEGTEAVSPHWRKNAERGARLLRREHEVALRCVEPDEAARATATLELLHGLRWGARDTSHAFADPLMRAFLHEAVPALAADGLLRLHRLTLGDATAAMVFAIGTPAAHYFYMSGFDPRWSRYSTGLVTILAAMRQAARERAAEFHFLRGGEAYKYHLGATDRPTFRRMLQPAERRH